jgi:hypothetical protein
LPESLLAENLLSKQSNRRRNTAHIIAYDW